MAKAKSNTKARTKRIGEVRARLKTPKAAQASADTAYREHLREAMLPLAVRIIEKDGLGALQARRVALDAKCSVGSVYNVFGDLDGLIIAANVRTVQDLGSELLSSFRSTTGQAVEARLLHLALAYKNFALNNLNRWRAIFEHRLSGAREVPAEYRADQARLLGLIEAIIADAIADGTTRLHAGRALFSAVHGIIALGIDHKLATYDPVAMEDEIRFIVSAAARGLSHFED